ncbi:MAG: hypothetical protein JXR13_06040 [Thalassovita sp.]
MSVLNRIAHAMIAKAERRVGVTFEYAHHIADVSLTLLGRYNRLFGFLDPRKNLPTEAYHAARLRGALSADCGTCVQAEMNLAAMAGLSADWCDTILSATPTSPDIQAVITLCDAVTRDRTDAPEARDHLRATYGEAGLIELVFAMNGAAMLPGIKRGLGYATACDLSVIRKTQRA